MGSSAAVAVGVEPSDRGKPDLGIQVCDFCFASVVIGFGIAVVILRMTRSGRLCRQSQAWTCRFVTFVGFVGGSQRIVVVAVVMVVSGGGVPLGVCGGLRSAGGRQPTSPIPLNQIQSGRGGIGLFCRRRLREVCLGPLRRGLASLRHVLYGVAGCLDGPELRIGQR